MVLFYLELSSLDTEQEYILATPLVVTQNNYATRIVNAYIVYCLDDWPKIYLRNFTLKIACWVQLIQQKIVIRKSGRIVVMEQDLMEKVWKVSLRDGTLGIQERGPEGFCGGHEIFLKIFDGSQKVSLGFPSLIFFSDLI